MAVKSTRTVIPVAVLAAAALALTGCSPHSSKTASSGTSDTATASAPSTPAGGDSSAPADGGPASVSATATAPGEDTPAPTASATHHGTTGSGGTSQAAPAAGKPCTSAQLRVARTDPSVGAGQVYAKITFTNTAATSCTLYGYPGVSYVKAAGAQSGNPAQRTGASFHVVTLAARGGTASATMHDSDGLGGFSKTQCDLTSVEGIRVYPPNERAAMFIPFRTEHCAGTGIHPLTIGPVS